MFLLKFSTNVDEFRLSIQQFKGLAKTIKIRHYKQKYMHTHVWQQGGLGNVVRVVRETACWVSTISTAALAKSAARGPSKATGPLAPKSTRPPSSWEKQGKRDSSHMFFGGMVAQVEKLSKFEMPQTVFLNCATKFGLILA